MILNPIETFKTSIHTPKHIKNTNIPFNFFKYQRFQNPYFSKVRSSKNKSVFGPEAAESIGAWTLDGHRLAGGVKPSDQNFSSRSWDTIRLNFPHVLQLLHEIMVSSGIRNLCKFRIFEVWDLYLSLTKENQIVLNHCS